MTVSPGGELSELWEGVVAQVPISSRAWLRRTRPFAIHGSTLMLAVSDETTRERIETKLRSDIETRLTAATGTPTYPEVTWTSTPSSPPPT